jgi:toxin ParE1/3/4
MSRCRFSPEAENDLDQLSNFIAERDPGAARRLINKLETNCWLLAGMPGMGRARPELRHDVRSFPVGPFVIFYRQIAGGIEIVRVVRGARDLPALFKQG